MGNKTKNLQLTNSGITEIFKTIFYNRFLISIIIPKFEHILIFGGGNIINYLDNLMLYINKIILESNKELQSIVKNKNK
jgi:hypothetical protein